MCYLLNTLLNFKNLLFPNFTQSLKLFIAFDISWYNYMLLLKIFNSHLDKFWIRLEK